MAATTQKARGLTKRQLELVVHLANGHRVEEIAVMCHLSASSVEKTIRAARQRTGARTVAHLVSLVIASGELEWNPTGQVRYLNGDSNV